MAVAAAPTSLFLVESARDDDMGHIKHTWLRSFADSALAKAVSPSYWAGHMLVRDRLLERHGAVVARLESARTADNDNTSICGWACFDAGVIHYVYVKPRWRRMGIARLLLEPLSILDHAVYTHRTHDAEKIHLPEGWIYNPYEAMR